MSPALTSVRLPLYEMSKAAAETIVSMCTKENASFSYSSFPTQLIIRDSCRPL
ncbi:MAG: substrate-binding domain-containing protein [Gorillibacterium sp.]|nr:substrate-binding domain-containing protein [Gorillibacterium sp.]